MTAPRIHVSPSWSGAVALLQSAGLPVSDLTQAHLEHFFYAGSATEPHGLIGLELHGSDALLRSLVVRSHQRAAGLGGALVSHAEAHAHQCGVRSVFLLTTTAAPFFLRRGYTPIERAQAPTPIRATQEFAEICPASSACLVKHLVS